MLVVTELGAKVVAGRRLQGWPPLTLKIDPHDPGESRPSRVHQRVQGRGRPATNARDDANPYVPRCCYGT